MDRGRRRPPRLHAISTSVSPKSFRAQRECSRHIFGQFLEQFHRTAYGGIFEPGSPHSDERGFRLDVLDALRELKVPNVRWPGGCFVSSYHWLDGVGPDRSPVYSPAWRVVDPNTFGTDEFLAWCEDLGADPYFCTNAGTGTAEEMAHWLEYTNRPVGSRWSNLRAENGHEDPYGVPFWSIGNENYGVWEIGQKTGETWAPLVAEAAKYLRRIDENIEILAAAVDEPGWMLPLLEQAGGFLNYVSIHGYWDDIPFINNPSPYLACIGRTPEPEQRIADARALIDASGQHHVKIVIRRMEPPSVAHTARVQRGIDRRPRPERHQRDLHDGRRRVLRGVPQQLRAQRRRRRHGEPGPGRQRPWTALRPPGGCGQAHDLPRDGHVREPARPSGDRFGDLVSEPRHRLGRRPTRRCGRDRRR